MPTEQIVESTPHPLPTATVTPIPKQSKFVALPPHPLPTPALAPILNPSKFVTSGSIAERVKARQNTSNQMPTEPDLSIAERVAARSLQKEQANPVLDCDTGEIFEYRQLLHHPKYKEVWNRAAANKFGQLAQGIKGRVEPTNTIEFIHKSRERQKHSCSGAMETPVLQLAICAGGG